MTRQATQEMKIARGRSRTGSWSSVQQSRHFNTRAKRQGICYHTRDEDLLCILLGPRSTSTFLHTTFGNRFNSQTQCIICVTVRRRKARPAPAYQEKSEGLVCEAFRLLLVGNWLSHTSSSMIVLGKQVREVWKIPRIPPRASPSEEYSEFPDFSSLFTQDYISLHFAQHGNRDLSVWGKI